VTSAGERDGHGPGTGGSSASPDASVSVDSLLREVARSPARAPGAKPEASDDGEEDRSSHEPGTVVAGRFRLERRLGEGGMGVVWQAVHVVTRKPVALKFLKPSGRDGPRAVQRFLREARAACAVRHPCVVEVHDVLELDGGSPVMVMELLSGETLAQRLAREHVLSLPELARIMVHVCSAVGCAHALGIVHRDLKPENIFLAQSPSGRRVKVLDFGIAKLTASEGDAAHTGATTGTGAILGTPYYMAPEQLFGEKDVDHRVDIWALGIILYEALAGERPTRGENVGQIYKVIVTDAIAPLGRHAPHLPDALLDLVGRTLSRDRTKRPPDVGEILAALGAYTNEAFLPVQGPPVALSLRDTGDAPSPVPLDSDTASASTVQAGSQASAPPPRRRSTRAIAVLVGGSVLAAVVGGLALRGRGGEGSMRGEPSARAAVMAASAAAPSPPIVAPAPAPSSEPTPTQPLAPVATAAVPVATAKPKPPAVARPAAPATSRAVAPSAPTAPPSPVPRPPASAADPASYQ
jgi:serine/threonine protein kinase